MLCLSTTKGVQLKPASLFAYYACIVIAWFWRNKYSSSTRAVADCFFVAGTTRSARAADRRHRRLGLTETG